MDIKIVFLTIAAAALSYNVEVSNNNTDHFSAVACQKFPVKQKELYHFVTFPDIAEKVCTTPTHHIAHTSMAWLCIITDEKRYSSYTSPHYYNALW